MANYDLITYDTTNERRKREVSNGLTIDFAAVNVGTVALTDSSGDLSLGDADLIEVATIQVGTGTHVTLSETSGDLSVGSVKVVNVSTPTVGTDAANKAYVDSVATGLDFKGSCKATAASALPAVTASGSGAGKLLTADAVGVLTVDGVSTWNDMANDTGANDPNAANPASRVLVNGQANAADNGIYAVQEKGDGSTAFILVRASDFDTNAEVNAGAFTFVTEGTSYADTGWVLSSDDIDIDVNALDFVQFTGDTTYSGGDGIDISGTVISVDLATNSGLEFSASELQVLAYDGIQIDANGTSVRLEAAGVGEGGLAFDNGEVRVTAADGITLTASGVEADLAAAGTGTGGLQFVTGEIAVIAGDGIELTATGVAADLEAAGAGEGGLAFDAGEIRVNVDTAAGLELTASGVAVNLETTGVGTGGLVFKSGAIKVELDGNKGLDHGALGLEVKLGDGLEFDGSGNIAASDGGTTISRTNNSGSTIAIRDVVYLSSATEIIGAVATVSTLDDFQLGIASAEVLNTAAGDVYVKPGSIVDGFSALVSTNRYYVSRSTAGAITNSLSGWTSGDMVYRVGRALSATELLFEPEFMFVY